MGQYQQWLQLREKERQLRAQLEQLEMELAELQARACRLQEPGSYEENPLLVLAARLNFASQTPSVQADQSLISEETPVSHSSSAPQMEANEEYATSGGTGETPALFPWYGPLDLRVPAQRGSAVPATPLAQPQIELLPEDMASFLDEHTQTSPQLQSPWWMRQPIPTSASADQQSSPRHTPTDYETMRNNREIERWLQRWHRKPDTSEQEGDV